MNNFSLDNNNNSGTPFEVDNLEPQILSYSQGVIYGGVLLINATNALLNSILDNIKTWYFYW